MENPSYVVDYKRMKRIEIPQENNKLNLNHLCFVIGALLFMYIFKRVKDKQSYPQSYIQDTSQRST